MILFYLHYQNNHVGSEGSPGQFHPQCEIRTEVPRFRPGPLLAPCSRLLVSEIVDDMITPILQNGLVQGAIQKERPRSGGSAQWGQSKATFIKTMLKLNKII